MGVFDLFLNFVKEFLQPLTNGATEFFRELEPVKIEPLSPEEISKEGPLEKSPDSISKEGTLEKSPDSIEKNSIEKDPIEKGTSTIGTIITFGIVTAIRFLWRVWRGGESS